LSNFALLGKLSNPEISCVVEKLEIIEENVKSLSWMKDGPVYFEREIAKLNRDIASKMDIADQDQTFQERLKKVEEDSNALKDISLQIELESKPGAFSSHQLYSSCRMHTCLCLQLASLFPLERCHEIKLHSTTSH
jgi:hypothetical protein